MTCKSVARVRFSERSSLLDSQTLRLVDELRRPSLVHEQVSNVRLLSPLHNIYKEKSPDFLLTIKIIISADTWTSKFHDSTVHVYYRADNILVLCIRQPLGCVCC